ncbi:uncharacterized protein AruCF_4810 [Achromobacter ruhlandii]|nr:uncharacterized protein AruCF_4810 [Achromobacter ruhlandii]
MGERHGQGAPGGPARQKHGAGRAWACRTSESVARRPGAAARSGSNRPGRQRPKSGPGRPPIIPGLAENY